jgi:hypothetical protein
MGVTLGGIGALVGGGSALAGLLGGGANQPAPPPPVYQPQNLPGADQGAYSGISGLTDTNTAGQTLPYAQQTFQALYNNPYAPAAQAGANQLGPLAYGAGVNTIGAGQSYLPYAQSALATGFDPQNALYAQQYQANTDATNAGLAQRGLAMSPYGAGVANTSNQNFNNQWLNQLLGRESTAAGTANTLTGAANNATTSGLNTATTGLNLPYATAQTIGGNQNNALSSYGGFGQSASVLPQQQIADYLQYLGLGNSAAAAANAQYATQLTAQNQNFNQMQTLGKNLGSSISGLGTAFGGSGGSTVAPYSSSGNPVSYGSYGGISFPQYT